jgi:hypothetical protein
LQSRRSKIRTYIRLTGECIYVRKYVRTHVRINVCIFVVPVTSGRVSFFFRIIKKKKSPPILRYFIPIISKFFYYYNLGIINFLLPKILNSKYV